MQEQLPSAYLIEPFYMAGPGRLFLNGTRSVPYGNLIPERYRLPGGCVALIRHDAAFTLGLPSRFNNSPFSILCYP
jgi:hypothetical protein